MLRSYVLVSLLNETADLRTRGKPLPDQSMGLTVGDKGETDARRRLSSCAPPNFNLNAEDADTEKFVLNVVAEVIRCACVMFN